MVIGLERGTEKSIPFSSGFLARETIEFYSAQAYRGSRARGDFEVPSGRRSGIWN